MPAVNEQPNQNVEMTAQTNGVETQQPVSLVTFAQNLATPLSHRPKN